MASTLKIGDRIVLRAEGGVPEAEFALFDPGDIELEATEPGIVREVGYRTMASEAIRRLEVGGVTLALTVEATNATVPKLAVTYARGACVRRVAGLFGATELFESNVYSGELRRYAGTWLDLPALSMDIEVARATALFQVLHLRALLEEAAGDTTVALGTREVAAQLRPGQRSFRRMSLEHVAGLPAALRALADKKRTAPPGVRQEGPTRSALLEALHSRVDASSDAQAHERMVAIETALAIRERPQRGPLSEPELWALEEQMSAGNASGVIEHVDSLERRRGRDPATSYLRARASLLTGRESPTQVAEKASAMAMAMSSFAELELLAAEAWAAAGHLKRAAPFARDLIDTPGTDDALRARAVQILSAAVSAGQSSIPPPAPKRPSRGSSPRMTPPGHAMSPSRPPPRMPSQPPAHESDRAFISLAPPNDNVPDLTVNRSGAPPRPSDHPPSLGPLVMPPPPEIGNEDMTVARRSSVPPAAIPGESRGLRSAGPPGGRSGRGLSPSPDQRRSLLPQAQRSPELMRGASQPPFRADSPAAHMHIPKAPPIPRPEVAELALELMLPPGLQGVAASAEVVPTSVIDARVHFTFLARQLGELFRTQYGIDLRADASGIEAIQSQLLEDYPDGQVKTREQAHDLRRYGAFTSEVLARAFGAFWVDIAPADLGYWAMVVPPDTRVWPFGRILRFIVMAHKERDLVSYFLELQARADKP
jgi:hypothetical protein